jgi:signal transduction histidine kinase
VVWYATGYTSGLINAPHLMAFFSLGATGDRRRELGVGTAAVMVLFATAVATDQPWASIIDPVGWTIVAILVGEVVHARRQAMEGFAERAERAEAERDARLLWAERRVAQERLGIARDLHDVLAHTLSAMTVQAGLAADALDRGPSTARAAVSSIRSAGRACRPV